MAETRSADDWRQIVFDATTAAMVMIERDGSIRCANSQALLMFGYAEDELIGRPVELLLPESMRRAHVQARRGFFEEPSRRRMRAARSVRARKRDGTEFPVEIRLSAPKAPGEAFVLATIFDLTGRVDDHAALAQRNAELESANERLARFAFVASQDLQEPLRKIAAFGDLMAEAIAQGDRAEVIHANEVMRRSARRAHALVHDLLALSRIANEELALDEIDLRQAIELALRELCDPIAETGARLDVRLPAVTIEADPEQFKRLVENIVANAIKYRKPDQPASIDITAFCDETSVCLAIADRGIGFEKQYAEKIFEPLKRLHSRVEYPGSGIGLAMCKAIADRHGWRISVEAEPGGGATFFIVLPLGGEAREE